MKNMQLLSIDLALILGATVLGAILRDNFETLDLSLFRLTPYFVATAVASLILIPLFGINRSIWRFSGLPDYLRITVAMAAICLASVAIAFAYDRLQDVPRSLPILQFNLAITLLIGARVTFRLLRSARRMSQVNKVPFRVKEEAEPEPVLLIGLSRLTEAYLQSVFDFAADRIRIAGILGHQDRHVGRLVASHPILDVPENIERVMDELKVKGVVVRKIVVTVPLSLLPSQARNAIRKLARSRSVELILLVERFGLEEDSDLLHSEPPERVGASPPLSIFQIQSNEMEEMRNRIYWNIKRFLDTALAVAALIIVSPFMILSAACIYLTMGGPVVFWQLRLGLGGRPFGLYKFRTMRSACGPNGRILSDDERLSRVGSFLRRTRMDELPQLFNIVQGKMSFVGPRPLLRTEQEEIHRTRLLVRPGLTGWAQVVGGRDIAKADKAALDVWYVRNAGLLLDIKIILKTIPIVVFGESISRRRIEAAWDELREAGVLRSSLGR